MKSKGLAIWGSTGSIGTQTLDVVTQHPERFTVKVLMAKQNAALLQEQIERYEPEVAVLVDENATQELRKRYRGRTTILSGETGLLAAAAHPAVDIALNALVGFAGLKPTLHAIEAGATIALANKETLVAAGELVTKKAAAKGVSILTVDSEHSAILQCLQGEAADRVERIILTASGGPFRGKQRDELVSVSVEACLQHPNWSMGKKITVDSASLANKGLEVIEAHWLFGMPYDKIEVVVHPQSIIHSMVEFADGAVMAQLGQPDMRVPIQYALTFPERLPAPYPRLDFQKMKDLTFAAPDTKTFAALALAYAAGRSGGTMPCVYNAANEVAVYAFLEQSIPFLAIAEVIESVMAEHQVTQCSDLEAVLQADAWARAAAKACIDRRYA
ncbi:1-deoxy-D-xylulose-5-phosphate reductoisomerase [Azotosporobacter soli]|uniref:1-deoxy-D-xylulose-5-phosphate reductoisomerase n=1 Tax=Azotosporobacter soli TaxID=3055040 RepID=UPI0031FE71B6